MNTPNTNAHELRAEILHHLKHSLGKDEAHATTYDWRMSLSLALRDHVIEPWFESTRKTYDQKAKRVYYLSMEFLIGRLIEDVMINLRLDDVAKEAMALIGQDYETVVYNEPDAALGNGGLGRLAACFMDSLSTLSIPAYGYGIRYEHGLFEQRFDEGRQIETAENWLAQKHAWEFERPEVSYPIGFGGQVRTTNGKTKWSPSETVLASAYDTPTVGWKGKWANTLRLWAAKPIRIFDLERFNEGNYLAATEPEALARTISRVLYPDDTTEIGKELRLKQEYFFTSASLQDIIRRFISEGHKLQELSNHVAIQLNDTHPAIAGPELVRILADEHDMPLNEALEVAKACLSYTNHTLLPEALERWEETLFAKILPRHLQIISIIEETHFEQSNSPVRIIEDGSVKMGELAFVMAHKVNGVSALHSELVKENLFTELNKNYPNRIVNQTNGITPRRWLYSCNPSLRSLINETIGTQWPDDLEQLKTLEKYSEDSSFQEKFANAKLKNKQRLAEWVKNRDGTIIDPTAMFDVQIKRIHEYKRQLMNLLETVALWNDIRDNPNHHWTPRLKIFGGKAAPGYMVAKEIIHLINDVGKHLNNDKVTKHFLQVLYPENYNVTMAEILIPAADLSEQISTAGKEASGTGNMKFALNGALTVGTLDGANVEIRDCVGHENFYLFGLTAAEVEARRHEHDYSRNAIAQSPRLLRALNQIAQGVFSPGDQTRYVSLIDRLYEHDYFLVTCDFEDYYNTQRVIDNDYKDIQAWTHKSILNTSRVGWFSSDRTISAYAKEIWNARSLIDG
ncbi:MAG: glycogen/starch/alpha-glucan phosphorylase [Nitratireductor sp.]